MTKRTILKDIHAGRFKNVNISKRSGNQLTVSASGGRGLAAQLSGRSPTIIAHGLEKTRQSG